MISITMRSGVFELVVHADWIGAPLASSIGSP